MKTEIFTCKYFKFGRNTTGLSQWHLRNFLACSIKGVISWVTNYSLILARNFSINLNFTCEIIKLPWQHLSLDQCLDGVEIQESYKR